MARFRGCITAAVLLFAGGSAAAEEATPDLERARTLVRERKSDELVLFAKRKAFRREDPDGIWREGALHFLSVDPIDDLRWAAVSRLFGMHAEAVELWKGLLPAMERGRQEYALAAADAADAGRFEDAERWTAMFEGPESPRAAAVRAYAASKKLVDDRLRFARDFWSAPTASQQSIASHADRSAALLLLAAVEGATGVPSAAAEAAYEHALRSHSRSLARRALAAWLATDRSAERRAPETHAALAASHRVGLTEADAVLLALRPAAVLDSERAVRAAEHLAATGETARAAAAFRHVLSTNTRGMLPDKGARDRCRVGLGAILEAGGRPADARALYEALEAPNDMKCNFGYCGTPAEVAFLRARCMVAEGRTDEAIRDLLLPEYEGPAEPSPLLESWPHEGRVDLHIAVEAGRKRLAAVEAQLASVASPKRTSVALARALIAMHRAAEGGDAAAVARALIPTLPSSALDMHPLDGDALSPQVRRAILLLSSMPEAPKALEAVFDSLPIIRSGEGWGRSGRGAIVGFLRRHPSAGARSVLRVLLSRADAGADLGIDRRILVEALEYRELAELP